jgi:hypothetical protein
MNKNVPGSLIEFLYGSLWEGEQKMYLIHFPFASGKMYLALFISAF